jgi:hypothetical protein
MPDGTVWTGHYDEWTKLSEKDKQTVLDARNKKRNTTRDKRNNSAVNITDLQASIADLTRSLAAVKSSTEKDNSTPPDDSVGDSFGGRQSKRPKHE